MTAVRGGNHLHHLKSRRLVYAIFINLVITVAQVIGGLISGSLSLLSDALHNFTDVISLIISYVATKLVTKWASKNKTFGFKRAEILAAFINAASLVVIAVLLIIEAVKRFFNPQIINSEVVIWLAIVAIIGNGFSVLLLKKDAQSNLNMASAYSHLLTDLLASVAVLVGGLFMAVYQVYWVDSVLTFLIALYLIVVGFNLLKRSTTMLMLFTPSHINIEMVVAMVNNIPDVKKLHHVHIWSLNENEVHLEAHLDVVRNMSVSEFNNLLTTIETQLLNEFGINHVTIQPEFNKMDSKAIIVQD
ncbi:cation diffusion facilitator family transporter [Bizionia sediminis]|uniref:Cation diffusion facilitator family transporter n=1 Tax=Bizionia sediminis TaxID=1737064 RepID=A0ABW5KRL9_9FLAO